jgi:hypothetical protein
MITISQQQFEAFEVAWEKSRLTAIMMRLREELPVEIGRIPEQAFEKQVQDGIYAALALDIRETGQIIRFLRLRYWAVESAWERPGAQEVLIRVLTDVSLEADFRLMFVETNLDHDWNTPV